MDTRSVTGWSEWLLVSGDDDNDGGFDDDGGE